MTTEVEQPNTVPVVEEVVEGHIPAPGAEDQKPNTVEPAPAADEKKAETPEQEAERKLSRRQRAYQRERDARVAAETEARLAREQLAKLEGERNAKPESAVPKRDDYPDYETYLDAKNEYMAKQAARDVLKADREERQAKEKQDSAASHEQKVHKEWGEREESLMKVIPDYLDTVNPFIPELMAMPFSPRTRQALLELGPQLLYQLAKNPDEAERIAELSEYRQIAELGKLEAALPAVSKKASEAPPPISKSKGDGHMATGLSANDSQTEYEAKRKAQGARWAR